MPAEAILLADEDTSILEVERFYLEREGFRIFSVKTGFDVLNSEQTIHPDLIVLGMDLPGLDGYDVCSRLRSENDQVPILAIFNGEGELKASFMQSLDADDYLVKPFNPRELVARVRVILHPQKRTLKHPSTALCFGSLTLDLARGVFKVKERVVPMRRLDQDLLACLLNNVGRYTSQADLMDGGWGTDDLYQTLSIDAHMARLQSLLRGSGARITSDPQAGYKLEKQEISMRSKPLD